jgi:hypothetical protein
LLSQHEDTWPVQLVMPYCMPLYQVPNVGLALR